ncbi:unnamed protein product, partial [Didymodactylos carnosus]
NEYAEEISDPKNRELYEKEIESIENQRGMNVTFIHPNPGHVLKTILNGTRKCFINIATNINVEKPSYEKEQGNQKDNNNNNSHLLKQRTGGMHWNLPHCLAPPRDDFDNKSIPCTVYDIVYHPDTYRMAETNKNFMQMIEESALDSIENNFKCKLDRNNIKRPKLKFKGVPNPTIIRKKNDNFIEEQQINNHENNIDTNNNENLSNFPQKSQTNVENHKVIISSHKPISTSNGVSSIIQELVSDHPLSSNDGYTIPTYKIIHRGEFDMQDLVQNTSIVQAKSTRPKELIVEIDLPLCNTSNNVDLDVYEKSLHIHCEKPKYDLTLNLPYPVRENDSHAKFDKKQRKLIITLAVIKEKDLIVNLSATESSTQVEYIEENKEDETNHIINNEKEAVIEQKPLNVDTTNYSSIPFDFKQGVSHIALVLHLKNVDKSSIDIINDGKHVYIKLCSLGEGYFPLSHQLYLNFDNDQEQHVLEPNGITINHSSENVVVILKKAVNNDLVKFQAGVNQQQQQLETKYFISSPISKPPLTTETESTSLSTIAHEPVPSESNVFVECEQKPYLSKTDPLLSTTKKQEELKMHDKKPNKKKARRMAREAQHAQVEAAGTTTTTSDGENETVLLSPPSNNTQDVPSITNRNLKSDITNKLQRMKFEQHPHESTPHSPEHHLQDEKKDKLSDMPTLLHPPFYRRHTSESSVDDEHLPNELKLKGILKYSLKNRSLSESDYNADLSGDFQFNSSNVFESTNDSSELDLSSSGSINNNTNTPSDSACTTPNCVNVKHVTFSNQVVSKTFKPNGPVSGMRKSSHNQRKNKNRQRQRKRRDSASQSSDGDAEPANTDASTKVTTTTTESIANGIDGDITLRKLSESSDDDTNEKVVDMTMKELRLQEKSNQDDDDSNDNDDDMQDDDNTVLKSNETCEQVPYKNPVTFESVLSWRAAGNMDDSTTKTKSAVQLTNPLIFELDN